MSTTIRARAADAAMRIAQTLRDPQDIIAPLTRRAASTLCYGLAGTALLHASLAAAEPRFASIAAAHWAAAARLVDNSPPDGIHTGPGALAASLIIGTGYLPANDPHNTLLPRATTWLSARAVALARHHHRAPREQATPWAVYDAIKGLAGIGRVLLAAHHRGHHTEAEPGLHAALSTLTHMILTPHGIRPGWWLPAALHPPTVTIPPTGAATTGLAHGVAGPLAFLATAHQAGHTLPGQRDAIHTAADWLLTWQTPESTWPPHISGDALDNAPRGTTARLRGRTTAWCYGTPGIATALASAGRALDLPSLSHTAAAAMTALAARPLDNWDIEGTALCHGSAGVLQSAVRLTCQPVIDHVTPTTLAPLANSRPRGFLTGHTGTALVLADLGGLLPRTADHWDCLILLS
ncbi:lanthionine synthetase LanC family protein [Streptomyces sp. x-80]|uniref:lanthionine synthetase LanC family protein n=1 Tax=Streptomyces sp. x-80 TaxID=2789282 RepID=UPI00397F9BEE